MQVLCSLSSFMLEQTVSNSLPPEEPLGWLQDTWVTLSLMLWNFCFLHLPWQKSPVTMLFLFISWLTRFHHWVIPHPKKVNACYNPFILSHLRMSICTLYMWMKSWLNIVFLGHISLPLEISRHCSTVLQPEMLLWGRLKQSAFVLD